MTQKERIEHQLQGIADELHIADNWARVERLADYIEDIITELEEL